MDGTAPLDDIDCDLFFEIGVDAVIHPRELQGRLHVPVDALHLGMERHLHRARPRRKAPQQQELAVADGDDGHHRVQLPVDPRAIIENRENARGGAKGFRAFECPSQQLYRAPVTVLS